MTVTIGRRELLAALGGAGAWPLAARAQPRKLPLVGVLVSASPPHPFTDALRHGLQKLGYSEGRAVIWWEMCLR
jgi:putative ABC transport system substrate-binding protein